MKTKTPQQEAAELAISILEGPVSAARILNVKENRHQTVQGWIRTRVPAEWCPAIEAATRAKGRTVTCEELRPDVAWHVLRGASAAQGA